MEEQAKLSQLQALVDEVAAHFGAKKWEAELIPFCDGGAAFSTSKSRVRFSRLRLDSHALLNLRFQLAVAIGANTLLRRWDLRGLAIAIFFVAMAMAISVPEPTYAQEAIFVPKFLAIFGALVLYGIAGLVAEFVVDARLKSEPFLRKLLEITRDVDRTRDFLVSKKAKPEELAKLDALVREMGLESPKPA